MRRLQVLTLLGLATACTAMPDVVAPVQPQVASEPASYVAIGDSLATGAGAERGYAERYAELLDANTEATLRFENLARDGASSADLLAALRGAPGLAEALSGADVVTINIGGNDLLGAQQLIAMGQCVDDACLHEVVDTFAENWDVIIAELDALVPADAELVTMDLYNPFVAEMRALGVLERLTPFLHKVNAHIRHSAAQHGMTVVPVHDAFNGDDGMGDPVVGGLIAPDRVHPSDAGHAAIAELILGATELPG